MPKTPSAYHRPESLDEALQLLAQPGVVPLGGGTKLLTGDASEAVVDLQGLGLDQATWTDTAVQLGAMTRLAAFAGILSQREDKASPGDLLQDAVHRAGPNTYRNAATLGGVIAARLPDSELLALLLALEAELTLHTPDVTTMRLADYLAEAERPSGLITQLTIPWQTGQGQMARVARTPADDPIVSVLLWQPEGETPRLAATGIGERPCRLPEAESILAQSMTPDAVEEAAQAARAANEHPGDFRGDAAYRSEMTAVLLRRVCNQIIDAA